jgi:lipopolysaccharide biosynthesis protein
MRVALHGHFYYPELVSNFLEKLAVNQTRCDLFLSTTDEAKADVLRHATNQYDRGKVTIRIVPNRGRDVGAFLTSFAEDVIGKYDVVGHVHGKRSLFVGETAMGDSWREFLWQNLLGDSYPMVDGIVERFASDEGLGIVFPEDPHLCDWDYNLEIATGLAQKMGIEAPLPPFFNFPVGTMFWARTRALAPLFDLGLRWDDYPEEPVAIDGTILHAIERLLPFAARHAGYGYATTSVPGITW